MGDGVCVSRVDYRGDSFTVMQYDKNTKKNALMKAVKKSASPQTKANDRPY
jgi:hypothetical protein